MSFVLPYLRRCIRRFKRASSMSATHFSTEGMVRNLRASSMSATLFSTTMGSLSAPPAVEICHLLSTFFIDIHTLKRKVLWVRMSIFCVFDTFTTQVELVFGHIASLTISDSLATFMMSPTRLAQNLEGGKIYHGLCAHAEAALRIVTNTIHGSCRSANLSFPDSSPLPSFLPPYLFVFASSFQAWRLTARRLCTA